MTARLKVLVSAYACSPYKGSEPGVGWGFVSALGRLHDLWVIVEEEKFRADIERYLAGHPEFPRSIRFQFLRKRRNRLLRRLWPPSYYWYYRRWHEEAFALAQRLHHEVGFDLAHQLTMVGFREPGYLWKLGIPFVWGPIGGMGLFPWRFLTEVGVHGALHYLGYNLLNLWQMRFAERPRKAAKAAGCGLIAATPENRVGAQRYWGCPSTVMAEVGLPPAPTHVPEQRVEGTPLRLIWSGQHTAGKALNLALEALANLPADLAWELCVLGKGRRASSWEQLCERLGLTDRVAFHGWLPREVALEMTASCHLLLITSLRDLTSTVSIEALALGLPIVCLDHCGFAAVVDESCGVRVPVTKPPEVLRGLAAAVERLGRDEELRYRLAKGAVHRARAFSWDAKAEQVDRIYRCRLAEWRGSAG